MKKLILSILALSLAAGSFAQNRSTVRPHKKIVNAAGETTISDRPSSASMVIPGRKDGLIPSITAVTMTDIGHSPNILTVGFGAKTATFAHPSINTITMVFRNDPSVANSSGGSGYYNYAKSTDGGATWLADQYPLYDATGGAAPPFADGRYPQGIIYNPTGNTDPNNAYLAFMGAGLAATNGTWGGIPNGALSLAPLASPVQSEILSSVTQVPVNFVLAPNSNNAYIMDLGVDAVTLLDYIDSMALYIGVWNGTTNQYDYTYSPVYAPVGVDNGGAKYIWEGRIAFAPNSNIGYMGLLGHPDFDLYPDSVTVPMMYKTTDGGTTWNFIGSIDLAGVGTALGTSAIDYSTWTECDLVVDVNGNAHFVVAIGVGNNDNTFSTAPGTWGIFDVYTTDGGSSWYGQLLGTPQTFEFIWGATDNATPEDSRPQAATTWAGDKVFFGWFDTDTLTFGTTENAFPDAHFRALDVNTGMWTNEMNLTTQTVADGACSFGNISPYVLGNTGTYTIPMTIQVMADPTVALATTTHKYVGGLEMVDADFVVPGSPVTLTLITAINTPDNILANSVHIYPNPASGRSNTLEFMMDKTGKVSVELLNTIGQVAKTIEYGIMNAGTQKVNLDVEGLQAGIYVVKIKAGDHLAVEKVTVK